MKILFAKISPAAQIPNMESAFQYDVKVADYLTAVASVYRLGANKVDFTLIYGNGVFDSEGKMLSFERLLGGSITLASPEIDEWGNDDTVILNTICEKLGTKAVDFIVAELDNVGMFS